MTDGDSHHGQAAETSDPAERVLQATRQRLAGLDDLPIADHVAVYDELHRELADTLDRLDREGDA